MRPASAPVSSRYNGSILVPGRHSLLTLTLKNIPEDLHAMLKESAERNRRSLNSEILARLERETCGANDRSKAHARELKAFTARLPKVEHGTGGPLQAPGPGVIVVDSNVIAYCWINGPLTALAQSVRVKDPEWHAPLLWRSEMRNIPDWLSPGRESGRSADFPRDGYRRECACGAANTLCPVVQC